MRPTTSFSLQRPDRPLRTGDLVRAAVIVLFIIVILQLLWSARLLVLTTFLGVLFGLSASRATEWVMRRVKVKRSIAAAGVVFGSTALLLLIFAWSGPTLVEQSTELRTKLPESVQNLETWIGGKSPRLLDAIAPPDSTGGSRIIAAANRYSEGLTEFAFGVVQSVFVVAAGIVLVIFVALYIAADPRVYRRGMMLLVPSEQRERFGTTLTAVGGALRKWFQTQLIAMVVIGVVTTIVLALIGVRGALPLGVLAGLFEFIPNIGPLLSAIPAVLMGFTESPQQAGIIALAYWGIQFLENNLLIPYLMREQLDLPPALTLLAQVIMAYVFGFLGLFVAIPVLAVAMVAVRTYWVEDDLPPLPTMEMRIPELLPEEDGGSA
ncbi:MAG: AI-2E family transporter [Gemmatimonadaceae bacterium]|nr:AI-2E family transporter [Gemmatimonadaceae bacterium]